MDFHSLSRKDLQALCKRNKIPANMTNVAMADTLAALNDVEGLEDFLNPSESNPPQSPNKRETGSPDVPRTSCRTSTRRKPKKEEPKSLQPLTRTRRGTSLRFAEVADQENKDSNVSVTPAVRSTRRRAVAASATKQLDTQMKETEEDEKNLGQEIANMPKTPSVPSSSIKATMSSAGQKMDCGKVGSCSVQRAYSTRRSVRLLEKTMEELCSMEINEKTKPVKDDNLLIEAIPRSTGPNEQTVLEVVSEESDHDPEPKSETKHNIKNEKELGIDVHEKKTDEFEVSKPQPEFDHEVSDYCNVATGSDYCDNMTDEETDEGKNDDDVKEENSYETSKQENFENSVDQDNEMGEYSNFVAVQSSLSPRNVELRSTEVYVEPDQGIQISSTTQDDDSEDKSKNVESLDSDKDSINLTSLEQSFVKMDDDNREDVSESEESVNGDSEFEQSTSNDDEETDDDDGEDSLESESAVRRESIINIKELNDKDSKFEQIDGEADEEFEDELAEVMVMKEADNAANTISKSVEHMNYVPDLLNPKIQVEEEKPMNPETLVEVAVMLPAEEFSVKTHESVPDQFGGSVHVKHMNYVPDLMNPKVQVEEEGPMNPETLVEVAVMLPAEEFSIKIHESVLDHSESGQTTAGISLQPFAADQLPSQFPRPTNLSSRSSTHEQSTILKMADAANDEEENVKDVREVLENSSMRQLRKKIKEKLQLSENANNKDKSIIISKQQEGGGYARIALQPLAENRFSTAELEKRN